MPAEPRSIKRFIKTLVGALDDEIELPTDDLLSQQLAPTQPSLNTR